MGHFSRWLLSQWILKFVPIATLPDCYIASLPHCHLTGQNVKLGVLSKAFNVFQTYNMVNTTAWNIALNRCECILYVLTSIWVVSTPNTSQNILFHRFSRQKAEKERKSKKWCNIYYSTFEKTFRRNNHWFFC